MSLGLSDLLLLSALRHIPYFQAKHTLLGTDQLNHTELHTKLS